MTKDAKAFWRVSAVVRCVVGALMGGVSLWQLADKRGYFLPWVVWTLLSCFGLMGILLMTVALEELSNK